MSNFPDDDVILDMLRLDDSSEGDQCPPVEAVLEEWAGRDPGASSPTLAGIRVAVALWIEENLAGWRTLLSRDRVFAIPPGPVPAHAPPAFAISLGTEGLQVEACARTELAFDEVGKCIVEIGGYMIDVMLLGVAEYANPASFDELGRLLSWPARPGPHAPEDPAAADIRIAASGIVALMYE